MVPIAAINLLSECYKLFCVGANIKVLENSYEVAFKWVVTTKERIENASRQHMVYFRLPDIVHYYISFTVHALSYYVNEWRENVNACNVLHANTIDSSLQLFTGMELLEVVFHVDECKNDSVVDGEPRCDIGNTIFQNAGLESYSDGSKST